MPLTVTFWGTPDYAVPSLRAIHAAGHRVLKVVTQPDRPAGRSMQMQAPPVKAAALALGVRAEAILQPESTRDPALYAALLAEPVDVACVVAYGGLLTKKLLALPRLYCLNAHGSLLPHYRGAAPVQAAILNGDAETGVTLTQMVRALDAGPAALTKRLPIGADETAGELMDRLAGLSADLFVEGLARTEAGTLAFTPQDEAQATFTRKIERFDACFGWTEPAETIRRKIRAYTPWPGLKASFEAVDPAATNKPAKRHTVTLLSSRLEPAAANAVPGTVLHASAKDGLVVVCGDGQALRIQQLKPEGKPAMPATDWLRGVRGQLRVPPDAPPASAAPGPEAGA
ncbi:MAG TPA: methionyl-tRNA formyltransferase [Planctomycetota bacterium]|nr:methionyl-tRNA formyltransferase [Planctomycetota bacterium]